MKRLAMLALLVVAMAGTGCGSCGGPFARRSGGNQGGCDDGSGACDDGSGRQRRRDQGGSAPTVAYPYYTTRGPRDFFACDPGYPRN